MSWADSLRFWAEGIINSTGYSGIILLTGLGNANIPIPSEAVMPFGGILAGSGKMNFHIVVWAGTLGSVLGSALSYGFGAYLGHDFLMKYGKFVLIRRSEIEHAERWFDKWGLQVTLWGRLVPIVRSFVSLPAGMYRSNFAVFLLYSLLGSLPWCYLWAYIGLKLGENWGVVEQNMKLVDGVVIGLIVLLIARFVWTRVQKSAVRSEAASPDRLE